MKKTQFFLDTLYVLMEHGPTSPSLLDQLQLLGEDGLVGTDELVVRVEQLIIQHLGPGVLPSNPFTKIKLHKH